MSGDDIPPEIRPPAWRYDEEIRRIVTNLWPLRHEYFGARLMLRGVLRMRRRHLKLFHDTGYTDQTGI